jgi:cytidine deaminase
LAASDQTRLSVAIVEVRAGREGDFLVLAAQLDALLARKQYARADTIRDETVPSRFYAVRQWASADAARQSHADPDVDALNAGVCRLALVNHVVNGVRHIGRDETVDDRRAHSERDRRAGFERRLLAALRPEGDRRTGRERRLGPRRQREGAIDLVGAARSAREHADAAFSSVKVGAALETTDGTIVTGCNIENATYGLTMCAERVAMFKALSEGHRGFTRMVIVADTPSPMPPCGACRQILWEFAGNLEIRLANLTGEHGTHRLEDLLPMPFDARLLSTSRPVTK